MARDDKTPRERFADWKLNGYSLGADRKLQRARIVHAVTQRHGEHAERWDRAAVLLTVDVTRPTDEMSQHGSRRIRAWGAERLSFVVCVLGDETIDEPTHDDYATCLVAADLVEDERLDEARQLLAEHAPRRFNRPCPACGAIAGKPCVDPGEVVARPSDWNAGTFYRDHRIEDRIVPHLSRVEPRKETP